MIWEVPTIKKSYVCWDFDSFSRSHVAGNGGYPNGSWAGMQAQNDKKKNNWKIARGKQLWIYS